MRRFFDGRPASGVLLIAVSLACAPPGAAQPPAATARTVSVELGGYRYAPDRITMAAGETLRLELVNTDKLTPHNFTLKDAGAGLDLDVDVKAGKSETVSIAPSVPGSYVFYCSKKLPLMKSHRERGMEGMLVVTPPGSD